MAWLVRVVLIVLVLSLLPAATAWGRVADSPQGTALEHALHRKGLALRQTAAVAIDLADGTAIFTEHATRPLRPASTEKLTIALTALDQLGPDYRIPTLVLGDGAQQGDSWEGDLVLRGFGDPSLHPDDLDRLARAVGAKGIQTVTGRVLGDEGYFDALRVGPGWKASYYKNECPPLSALIVDRAWLDGHTRDEPARAAAKLFTRALEAAGVSVTGTAGIGTASADAIELAHVRSPRLRALVAYMDTESDNFIAEMLLKQLGAHERHDGSTATGAAVVRAELARRKIPLAGVAIADGSGLSQLDRLTVGALAALLLSARMDTTVATPFLSSLAVAGETGTLEDRMTTGPAHSVVRAKTGTTDRSSALAGYVDDTYVFAIFMNGDPVANTTARSAQDRFVQLLAGA